MNIVEPAEKVFKQVAPPAFNEQDTGERRNQPTKKISQSLLFHVGQDSVLSFLTSRRLVLLKIEEARHRSRETRKQRIVDYLFALQPADGIAAMDHDRTGVRINNPNGFRATLKINIYFRLQMSGRVAGRNDFDCQIRRTR